jgi:hypothetical protein
MNTNHPPGVNAGHQPKVPLELSQGRLQVTLRPPADDSWRSLAVELSAEQLAGFDRLWALPRVETWLQRKLKKRGA